uniref:B1 bradykinin receptor-like n=1 Tax=Petromyzon marinus TaxID=7757 RepID=A0AAJ7X0J7_PETMA|nr:B1 bradykinin receptor-like [Petromyzon marinus]
MSTTSNISWVTSLDPNRTAWANHSERDNASEVLKPCLNADNYFAGTWDIFTSATPVLILTAFALGLVLNLAVLLVYALHCGVQTVADVYVTNLTVAELLLVVNLPFWAVSVKRGLSWPFGDFMCRATNAVLYVNKYASVFFLAAVSLDQHQVICKTMQSYAKRRVSRVRLRCVVLVTSDGFQEIHHTPRIPDTHMGCTKHHGFHQLTKDAPNNTDLINSRDAPHTMLCQLSALCVIILILIPAVPAIPLLSLALYAPSRLLCSQSQVSLSASPSSLCSITIPFVLAFGPLTLELPQNFNQPRCLFPSSIT